MRVKKSQLATLAMAVSAVFSGAAFAGVDYTATTPVPNNYAAELRGTSGTTVFTNSANATADNTPTLNFQFQIGFGASAGQNRYLRVDLPSGATFTGGQPLLSTNANTTNTTLVAGGSGNGFAVWQITAASGTGIAGTQPFVVSPSSVTLASGFVGDVTMRVTTHETAVSATGGNSSVLATPVNSLNYLRFTSTVTPSITNVAASTLQAAGNFQAFISGTSTTNIARIATVNVAFATNNLRLTATASNDFVGATDLIGTNTQWRMSVGAGGFGSAAGTAFLGDSSACTGTAMFATASAAVGSTTAGVNTSVTFVTGQAAVSSVNVCFAAPTGTAAVTLPDNTTFNMTYAPVFAGTTSQAGISPTSTPFNGTAGTNNGWVREGVTLQAPWAAFNQTGVVSRIFMTNTNLSSVACTARVVNDGTGASVTYTGGSTAGFGFTIPAGTAAGPAIVEVPVSATSATTTVQPILSAFSGNARGVIAVTCIAPSNTIQGNFVLTFTTAGTAVNSAMLRAGTN